MFADLLKDTSHQTSIDFQDDTIETSHIIRLFLWVGLDGTFDPGHNLFPPKFCEELISLYHFADKYDSPRVITQIKELLQVDHLRQAPAVFDTVDIFLIAVRTGLDEIAICRISQDGQLPSLQPTVKPLWGAVSRTKWDECRITLPNMTLSMIKRLSAPDVYALSRLGELSGDQRGSRFKSSLEYGRREMK